MDSFIKDMDPLLGIGFDEAKRKTNNFHIERKLEDQSKNIARLILSESEFPSDHTLRECKALLYEIEQWKINLISCRSGNSISNSEMDIFVALRGMLNHTSDKEKLLSIMNLKGFGASIDEYGRRRSKVASAVLRFFYPESWGVVDWRIFATLTECNKYQWDVDKVLQSSSRSDAKSLRIDLDVIDHDMCVWINESYREIVKSSKVFQRVADVDMALFHFSWLLWKGGMSRHN